MGPDFYREVLDHLYDGVYFVDRNRCITYWNKGAERITGYAEDMVVGRCCADNLLMHVNEGGEQLCHSVCPLAQVMRDRLPREVQVFLHHADGHRVPVLVRVAPLCGPDGEVIGAVESFSDNSSMMAALRRIDELDDAAYRDPLTGVGNRRFAELKIQTALAEYPRHGQAAAVFFADVDHFKGINDNFGHHVGDRVLATVARTLASNVRASDVVSRWGGEEFVALLGNVDASRLDALADKLRQLVATSSVTVTDRNLRVTVSIGATLMRVDDNPATLIARADRLMYQSKQGGRNRVTCEA